MLKSRACGKVPFESQWNPVRIVIGGVLRNLDAIEMTFNPQCSTNLSENPFDTNQYTCYIPLPLEVTWMDFEERTCFICREYLASSHIRNSIMYQSSKRIPLHHWVYTFVPIEIPAEESTILNPLLDLSSKQNSQVNNLPTGLYSRISEPSTVAPEHGWLENDLPFEKTLFSGANCY